MALSQFKKDEIAFELRHEDAALAQARRRSVPATRNYTADQVWAYASTADRINGGYCKMDEWMRDATPPYLSKRANKSLVKEWLRDNYCGEDTEADWETGRRFRQHFNSYTFLALQGNLNDFQHQALKIAQMDEFTGRNMLEFSIVSCLPDVARRDQANAAHRKELFVSEPVQGAEGDRISGYFTVDRCQFNANYNKFRIQGRMGESFVDFWFGRELSAGADLSIKAKIKRQRPDKSTQLNFVKIG